MKGGSAGLRIVVLGALSAIGIETARLFAVEGARLVIAGRNGAHLAQVADDLKARGAQDCQVVVLDFVNVPDPHRLLKSMFDRLDGPVDIVMVFYGALGDQTAAEADVGELRRVVAVNFSSAAEWCVAAAAELERQDHGTLIVISSVAGDRGRQSNYVYGAAKAGLSVLLEGIAHRLARTKARAVVVKLGMVDTPMTAHLPKGGLFWVQPDRIARDLKKIADRPTRSVVYAPWFWRPIMFAIRNMPTSIFHRTKL